MNEQILKGQKRRRSTVQQPGTKGASRLGDNPLVNRSLCSPIGLNGVSLVCASGGMSRRRVFDVLGGAGDGCPLGAPFCQCPVLPGPAPPSRRAPRPDPPVARPGLGLDKFWTKAKFLSMPCMKKAHKVKNGDVPHVSSQEQRALPVRRINRLSTGYQPVVNRPLSSPIG